MYMSNLYDRGTNPSTQDYFAYDLFATFLMAILVTRYVKIFTYVRLFMRTYFLFDRRSFFCAEFKIFLCDRLKMRILQIFMVSNITIVFQTQFVKDTFVSISESFIQLIISMISYDVIFYDSFSSIGYCKPRSY